MAAQAMPLVSTSDSWAAAQEAEGQEGTEEAAEPDEGPEVDSPLDEAAAYPTSAKVGASPCSLSPASLVRQDAISAQQRVTHKTRELCADVTKES